MEYTNQTALITGASSGIGEGFARELHSRGANLVLVARREDRLKALCQELNALRADSACYIVADVATDEVGRVLDRIKTSPIDILVSNAGRGSFGCFESLSLDAEVQMVEINAIAPLRLMHAVIPQMKERRHGAIISVSSVANFQPLPFMATYAATKSFNFSHALGLRYELAPFGVRVLAVCPGPVATEFGGVARVPGTVTGGARDSVERVVAESLAALQKNKPYVVPCLRAKLLWLMVSCLPRGLTTWLTERTLRSTLDHVTRSS